MTADSEVASATLWPDKERADFNAAQAPYAPVLARPKACRKWGPRHWKDVESANDCWLGWLAATNQLDPSERPGQRCTRTRLRAFIECLLASLAPATVLDQVRRLGSYFNAFDPDFVGRHLRDADRHLRQKMHEGRGKEIPSLEEFDVLGIELMEAGRIGRDQRDSVNFVLFRDGLQLRYMSYRPLRRLNFTEITVRPTDSNEAERMPLEHYDLQLVGETWWLYLKPQSTKAHKSTPQPFPKELVPDLEEYLLKRKMMLRGAQPTDRLWISYRKAPEKPRSVSDAFSRRTKAKFDKGYRTHAVRHAAGSKARSGEAAATILGNTPRVARSTYRHVNKGKALRDFHAMIETDSPGEAP